MAKKKILIWADYCCATGFATVSGNIARELEKTGEYEIDVVAINYSGDPYDPGRWPGNVYPAMPGNMAINGGAYADVYGRQRVIDLLGRGQYDVLFMIQDTFVLGEFIDKIVETQDALKKHGMKSFKSVYYYPIDAQPRQDWITEVVTRVDFPVAYTEYARKKTLHYAPELEDRLRVIYHGTNLEDFHYIEDRQAVKEFRDHFFFKQLREDRFVVINVNRNQPRKDPARNFMVLKELWKLREGKSKPLFYLHMQYTDQGGFLFAFADQLGLGSKKEFFLPAPEIFNANQGMPIEQLNLIYNAADAVFTPTLGEGWGLSLTEAMATKTPIIAPDNSSVSEILADNRGILVGSGDTPSNWTTNMVDNDRVRPTMNVEDAAQKLSDLMDGKNTPDIEGAYKWARDLSWEAITQQWIEVIDEAAAATTPAKTDLIMPKMNRAARRRSK